MNSDGSESSSALFECEDAWTKSATTIVTSPPTDLPVTTAPLFDPQPTRAARRRRLRSARGSDTLAPTSMDVRGKIVVVTGAAQGIGRALCERLHAAGAARVIATDRNADGAREVAERLGGLGFACDVSRSSEVEGLVARVEKDVGPIDLYCSNAGILESDPDFDNAASATDDSWSRSWAVNVMGHVHAARAVLPFMIARRQGNILNTVSAAGLLTQVGSATYSTTKHAALGFTEHLAITHRDHGIGVSALCPQGVDTPMIQGASGREPALLDGVLTPRAVADAAIDGLARDLFLILPHPQVTGYFQRKAADYDRWIGGMAKLRRAQRG